MATRFYPDPTNTPDVSPAFTATFWDDTSVAVRRKLVIDTPGNNASTNFSYTDTVAGDNFALLVQFVSEPLDSISALFAVCKFAFRCYEDSAKAEAQLLLIYSKCDGDGSNVVEFGNSLHPTEFDIAYVNRSFTPADETNGSLSQGDRLIVEVGTINGSAKTDSYVSSVNVTDNHATTDLPENNTETAAYNSWFETGDTFTEATSGVEVTATLD